MWVHTAFNLRRAVLCAALALACPMALTHAARGRAAEAPEKADAKAAEQLIRRTVDKVFVTLRDPQLAKDKKRRMQQLRLIVDEAFDWATMARSSLGPHWRTASEAERARFIEVFKELLAQQYMDDIDRFRGSEEVAYRGSDIQESLVKVKTVLITSSREQVPMDYTLQQEDGRLGVIDLAIEGVSLVNHYRKTFSRYLVNKSLSELLAQLERKLGRS